MTNKSDSDEVFSIGSRIVIWIFGIGLIYFMACKVDKSWDEIKVLKEQVNKLESKVKTLHWQTRNLQQNKTGLIFQWLDYED